ncbi:polygalacturonase ADPG2-like [Typha latifolia]|uniref:polygalacturonase ADPG2-like n=1 Tax=Typha latifolia TaxID=4733 RepID=UPI003C2E4F78
MQAFFVLKCKDVQLSDLKFVNSPRKHLSLYDTVGAQVSRLTIKAPEDSPNTDGIHIQNSQNVTVFKSTIGTGDDCISIGTGTSNINISHILCGPGHGISIGSLGEDDSEAKVERIHIFNCRLSNTTNGVRIKTWQGGSGYAKDISFINIFFDFVEKPIVINQYYCDDNDNCSNKTSSVQITDVYYNNVKGSSSEETAIILDCSETTSCNGIVMENINIKSAKDGDGETTKASCFNAEVIIKGDVKPRLPCSSDS